MTSTKSISEERTEGENIHVFEVEEDLVVSNRVDLRDRIYSLIEKEETNLVVDLSGTKRIDSAGLGLLAAIDRMIDEKKNGKAASENEPEYEQLRVVGASGDVKELIHLTRLNMMFSMHQDMESALNSF